MSSRRRPVAKARRRKLVDPQEIHDETTNTLALAKKQLSAENLWETKLRTRDVQGIMNSLSKLANKCAGIIGDNKVTDLVEETLEFADSIMPL